MPEGKLKVPVTGPTGDIGRWLLRGLERSRRSVRSWRWRCKPFDPVAAALRKTTDRQGDGLSRPAVDELGPIPALAGPPRGAGDLRDKATRRGPSG